VKRLILFAFITLFLNNLFGSGLSRLGDLLQSTRASAVQKQAVIDQRTFELQKMILKNKLQRNGNQRNNTTRQNAVPLNTVIKKLIRKVNEINLSNYPENRKIKNRIWSFVFHNGGALNKRKKKAIQILKAYYFYKAIPTSPTKKKYYDKYAPDFLSLLKAICVDAYNR